MADRGPTRPAGADGCRAGWICVARAAGGAVEAFVAPTAAGLLARLPRPAVLAIDVPIGLPEQGSRRCDEEARRRLGARRASVFPAPPRGVLAAGSWREACEARQRIEGKRISRQAWAIAPKVREVDELLRADPSLRARVREVHPELCFLAWSGRPMRHSKKRAAGRAERRELVDGYFGRDAFAETRRPFRRSDVADDDLLDAFAALWTAERILSGDARVLPERPPLDACGLAMEIVL
jgi:predicted RNase H-like nuclease